MIDVSLHGAPRFLDADGIEHPGIIVRHANSPDVAYPPRPPTRPPPDCSDWVVESESLPGGAVRICWHPPVADDVSTEE